MYASTEQVTAAQAVYTRGTPAIYDYLVLGLANRFIWKCPSQNIVALYDKYVSANHLDVGVGTGYFLDRCRFPSDTPRIALMDLNPKALAYTANRIKRYHPECIRRNALAPFTLNGEKFQTIGINYLLHCLPGPMLAKAVVFDHLKTLLKPGGMLFGATLVQGPMPHTATAKWLMELYNKKGIFSNREDNFDDLSRALRRRFREVSIEARGCAALFTARV